jgi:4-diphosphocytidyl-2-C-methyl-D-erythritol kinase
MITNSHAKVNLYLQIGKKLKNNYHKIESVMQMVQLHDTILFEALDVDEIKIESNNKDLENEDNLAYKAASLLKEKFNVKKGIKIVIMKNIPLSSGLGGGSSNAANTLIMLNKIWDLNLSHKELIDMALSIGSDVPFFINAKSALVESLGEKIKPLKRSTSMNIVLVNPGIKVSTKWAYNEFDKLKSKPKVKETMVKDLVKALNKKEIKKVSENLYNDFDPIISEKYKVVKEIKLNFKKFGALNSLVTGSGPTVLGIFSSIYEAREAYFKLRDMYPFVYLTKTF